MIAFVLSGGSNYGAMQAGALQALAQQNIIPDIIIGTSAGALNGAQFAYDPSPTSAKRLVDLWQNIKSETIFPGGYPTALFRVAQGKTGLFSNRNLKAFLRDHLPPGVTTFGDITRSQLFVVATQIPQGELTVFGHDPTMPLLDALLASSALPPLHAPFPIDGKTYIDGSLASKFPLKVAVEMGAKTIFALHIYHNPTERPFDDGIVSVSRWSINKLLHDIDERELTWAKTLQHIDLHYIQLKSPVALAVTDFSQGEMLIEYGYQLTHDYLGSLPSPEDDPVRFYMNTINQQLYQLPGAFKNFWHNHINPTS